MALRDQPYFPLYVMDFLSDEKLANCSAESTGVYIRLMCIMHKMEDYGSVSLKAKEKQEESNVHNFATKLTRQMPYTVEVIERSLTELVDEGVLILDGDRLIQKRMVRDGELSKKRAVAGAKGGKGYRPTEFSDDASKQKVSKTSSKIVSKKQANYENETENEYEGKDNKSLIEQRFDEFWTAYPKKAGKGHAKKSFLKIAPNSELFEKIMTALEVAKRCEQWKKENGQFIPYPATWLNQERWEDEYIPVSSMLKADDQPWDWNGDSPFAKWGESQ